MMKLNSWNSKIGLIQKNSIKEYFSVKKDISFTDKCIKVNKKQKIIMVTGRDLNSHGQPKRPRDFKSLMSTDFTTWARN